MQIMLKLGRQVFLIITVLWLLISCQKRDSNLSSINERGYFPTSTKEKQLVEKIKKIESVLRIIYRDIRVTSEVNAAAKCGFYGDEIVALNDLLNPDASSLYQSDKFKNTNVQAGVFKASFLAEFNRLYGAEHYSNRNSDYFEQDGITIYFPYSEDFSNPKGSEITLVPADRDADEGPGNKPDGTNPDGTTRYVSVTVNDEYAAVFPTHIVGVIDRMPQEEIIDSLPPPSGTVDRVFHGRSRLARNYDKLISFTGNGGGSEMKIARISGYLQIQNQQVSNFAGDVVSVHYKRRDIRRKNWKYVYTVWDPDWISDNNEQVYSAWEEDTEGTKTFEGSLNTTIKDSTGNFNIQGSIGFSISVKTQDELITQRKISRYAYFTTAKQDQGGGFDMCHNPCGGGNSNPCQDNTFLNSGSWPIWDCGADWKYLWPYKIY